VTLWRRHGGPIPTAGVIHGRAYMATKMVTHRREKRGEMTKMTAEKSEAKMTTRACVAMP